MKRRSFLCLSAAAGSALWLPNVFSAGRSTHTAPRASTPARDNGRLLILVELKGGNDGLNTVIPFAEPAYYRLRKNIALKREHVIQLDERTALHPSLGPLLPVWRSGQLAIVQGVGYAQPNLSHFRSTQIWDTASHRDEYLREGWLARAFASVPSPADRAAHGVVIGSAERGPLAHGGATSALAGGVQARGNSSDIAQAWGFQPPRVHSPLRMSEGLACSAFGASIEKAMQMIAAGHMSDAQTGRASQVLRTPPASPTSHALQAPQTLAPDPGAVAAIRLTLNGFDTHRNQPDRHRLLLTQLAEGLTAMRAALVELGRWNDTLLMTYSEFGRHPRENDSRGSDHGSVAPHFMMGGRVAGGLHGARPQFGQLEGDGNLPVGVDFRRLYATVLARWWGLGTHAILRQHFEPLPLLRV
ncbi:DUF1501 domain-containing protein [Burkholderia sp. WSM2232]|uniref:DUF1501 domain-containing protein n=1 Tax=Burkholderia sp. WSM2232 TaxID=944436 RepID=UPI0003F87F9C|nr:DUF1501 domain-containing protein [Burkholderia sp. WSM2232]